jgi:hypothetical protein
MRARLALLGLMLSLLWLAGCGGLVNEDGQFPFAGSWSGPWQTDDGQSGTLSIGVTGTGGMSGNMVRTSDGAQANVDGVVQGDGTFSGTVQYPNAPTLFFNGTFQFNNQGQLTGTYTLGNPVDGTVAGTLTLTR